MNESIGLTNEGINQAFESIDKLMTIMDKHKDEDVEQYNKIEKILKEHKSNLSDINYALIKLTIEFNKYKDIVDESMKSEDNSK